MLRRCVIQYAHGAQYLAQAALTQHRTIYLCGRHQYDYRFYTYPPSGKAVWEKVPLIRQAILDGYHQVFWLDTDAIWHADIPLHAAITTDAVFSLTYHEACPQQTVNHFNIGVMYVANQPNTLALLAEWQATSDDGHPWAEQYALNKIIFPNTIVAHRQYPMLQEISHQWNAMPHIPKYFHPNPVVLAWHGHHDATSAMKEFLHDSN